VGYLIVLLLWLWANSLSLWAHIIVFLEEMQQHFVKERGSAGTIKIKEMQQHFVKDQRWTKHQKTQQCSIYCALSALSQNQAKNQAIQSMNITHHTAINIISISGNKPPTIRTTLFHIIHQFWPSCCRRSCWLDLNLTCCTFCCLVCLVCERSVIC